ncbi:N-acetyltransferase [Pseudoclavibacter sp. RFBJ3]|uniref:GNAT family N-acetyltransferase n=1 Tax=unclassified Pseudoclavibacter TaxID=2615177 RepID=UPI000CE8598D|nr:MULTISPECIES: GNAT family N-acetyltransferase [unclassified Pseudoclavibacter]PPF80860.1 N-acetyltransferase [Pseudoclavibacter sp. RFBJ5]PPF94369.1 N-acetyltransferase [Pseudoclavibacter sp. RFBJ3]PPF99476.1 N-acetyltransferase [Pseudoclavibacter sp. RFBH5]PPG25670.1 N-acetyltransferase [Pseudoclavibacter sp. RFBI4]
MSPDTTVPDSTVPDSTAPEAAAAQDVAASDSAKPTPAAPAGFSAEPLRIPSSLDDVAAAAFHEMTALRNAVTRDTYRNDDFVLPAEVLLPGYEPSEYERRDGRLIREHGRLVGRVLFDFPLTEDVEMAKMMLEIHPDARGRGFGAAAYEVGELAVRDAGRSEIRTWVVHREMAGPRIPSPSGVGDIPALDPAAQMLLRRGFELGQVERMSVLELGAEHDDALRALRDGAREAAGAEYRCVSWSYPTPDEFIDGYAALKARMSTDAPQGDLVEDEQEWDARRVREELEATAIARGDSVLVGAVQHVPTGELVAFSELQRMDDGTRRADQEDTLVLREHRGNRLGMLVKAENLLAWRAMHPDVERVYTYNAEENRPMLNVNEALGFRPFVSEGAWRKVLV